MTFLVILLSFAGTKSLTNIMQLRLLSRLLMSNMSSVGVLDGHDGHMSLTCCLDLLREGRYEMAGKLIRWSLLQGGPGLPVFSCAFYALWTGDDTASICDEVDFITDKGLCQLAKQVCILRTVQCRTDLARLLVCCFTMAQMGAGVRGQQPTEWTSCCYVSLLAFSNIAVFST